MATEAATILFLQSVNDSITRTREMLLRTHHSLAGFSLRFCYALDSAEKDTFKLMSSFKKGDLDTDDLELRLFRDIRRFSPILVVVHAGFVFRTSPAQMLDVLSKAKSIFPQVPFGILERPEYLESDPEFSQFWNSIKTRDNIFRVTKELEKVRRVFF